MDTELLPHLLKSGIAGSGAIVLVLALRNAARRRFGSGVAYMLWWLLAAAILATLLPARTAVVETQADAIGGAVPRVAAGAIATPVPLEAALLWAWGVGVGVMVLLLAWQQWRFRSRLGPLKALGGGLHGARASTGLPAVMGMLVPRIVLPVDFTSRYSESEQHLVLQHERIHLRRGDLQANAAFALLRCVYWFNPLFHIAADRFRRDQELACDEAVIRRHPDSRRTYGEAMLKTQLAEGALPFGCHWHGQHPLKERIAMLKRPVHSRKQWLLGAAACALLSCVTGVSVWAAQPATAASAGQAKYVVERRSFVDGQPGGLLTQHVRAGAAFISTVGSGDGQWENAMVVTPGPSPGTVRVSMKLRHGDPPRLVATPSIVVLEGATGSIEHGDESGRLLYRHDVRVTRVIDADQAAATAARREDIRPRVDNASKNLSPPKYPAQAVADRITGKVVLLVDVAVDGSVADARVEKAEPAGVFDQATLDAVENWRFEPATRHGRPAAGRVRVPVYFDMDPEGDAGTGEADGHA